MKNLYHSSSPSRHRAFAPSRLFSLLLFSLLLLPFFPVFSQQSISPGTNPTVIRWQTATFPVTLTNTDAVALTDLTLEATGSTGYTVTNALITGITIDGNGTSVHYLTVITNCDAPQLGGIISYSLKNASNLEIAAVTTSPITIAEPEFPFTRPGDYEVDFISATKTYTRIWAIQQSSAVASVTHVQVRNACNKGVLEITQIELVDDALGTNVLLNAAAMAGALNTGWSGGYAYILDPSVFNVIGNNNGRFDVGEIVYIRETYKVLSCGNGTSTYTFGHGDGTNFCFSTASYNCQVSVARPAYIVDIVNTRNITFPTSLSNTGQISLTLTNNSTDPKAVLHDAHIWTNMNDYMRYFFTRAYMVNAAGVPLPGFPDLAVINNSILPGYGMVGQMDWVFTFENFTDVGKQAEYEAMGFRDISGDGIWNDMMPGATCYVVLEYRFDPWQNTATCPFDMHPMITRFSYLGYKDACGEYDWYIRPYSASNIQLTTQAYMGVLRYFAPQSAVITPPNFRVGDVVELRIDERPSSGSDNTLWTFDQNYVHYIIVTLPEGFDYDDSQPGFSINALAPCATEDVVRTVVGGRVVLTVHNVVANAGNSNQYYRIPIFAPGPISPSASQSFDIAHEWAYPDLPNNRFRYGCYTVPVTYNLIVPGECMSLQFDAKRMTFGWTDKTKTERITEATADGYGVRRDVAGPYDNVDLHSKINIVCSDLVDPTDHWWVSFAYDGSDPYFFFPNPDKAVEVILNGGAPFYIHADDVQTVV
ncbi:MAG: hypothetical protein FWF09_08795, partial [Bacteroidales bacterium]|nr:hypothetical protein [Bacteroidales bacterium]